jgi:hypothetical protein
MAEQMLRTSEEKLTAQRKIKGAGALDGIVEFIIYT